MLTLHAERRQKSVGEDGELGQGVAGSMTHCGSHSVTRYSHTSQFRREMKWTWRKTGAAIRARGGCGLGLFGLQGSPKLNEGKCAKMFRVGTSEQDFSPRHRAQRWAGSGSDNLRGGGTVLGNAVTDHNNSSAASLQKRRGAPRTHIRYHSLPTSLLAQPLSAA